MRLIHYLLLNILFLLTACAEKINGQNNIPKSESAFKTKNVIIVVVDGPRYSETWGDSMHQHIPHMSKDLAKEGAVFTSFLNDGFTYTNSGHTAITTGYRQEINNSGKKDYPKYPSIFQYYLQKTGKEKTAAWVITTKDKLEILSNTVHPEWQNKFLPSTDCGNNGIGTGYREDSTTFKNSMEILKKHHPNLVLINFKEPDASGHANNWEGYLKGIKDTDNYVWELWKMIQTDSIYKNNTAFIVTNDHGRHLDNVKDGFINHGCSCDGCRHINLFVWGPDFKKNVLISEKYAQQDITATIAFLLNLEMPYSEGKVIEALFKK